MYYKKNRAKCLICEDILNSDTVDNWIECSCGSLKIRGGKFFLDRIGEQSKYKEMSQIEIPDDVEVNEEVTKDPPPPLPF